jgi:hypothetical protein
VKKTISCLDVGKSLKHIHSFFDRRLARDKKILAVAAFNERIDVLLATDRGLLSQGAQLGRVSIMLPKQLWDYCIEHGKV